MYSGPQSQVYECDQMNDYTNDYLPLFDRPLYQHHSEPSFAAAQAIEPSRNTLREAVFAAIRDRGAAGATDDELQCSLGMNPSTERPRRVELVEAGRVLNSGLTRPTRSGRKATVWICSRREQC